ncbi:MAG: hypothetical protein AB7J35_03675 [Dehalococcoidia bacterium]
MRRWLLLLAMLPAALAPLLSSGGAAYACSCAIRPTPTDLTYVDTVFAGTVSKVGEWDPRTSSATPIEVVFNVDYVWLGEANAVMRTGTAASGASCGYTFAVGERYLVFARDGQVNLCSPTRLYDADSVKLLESVTGPGQPVAHVESIPFNDDEGIPKTQILAVAGVLIAAALAAGLWVRQRVK